MSIEVTPGHVETASGLLVPAAAVVSDAAVGDPVGTWVCCDTWWCDWSHDIVEGETVAAVTKAHAADGHVEAYDSCGGCGGYHGVLYDCASDTYREPDE